MAEATLPLEVLADRYRLERELGRGGMAAVYLAEDLRHHRKVAIKVLHDEIAAEVGPQRFLHEIELTAQLQHPNILPLFDSGSAAGADGVTRLYYVMPFVAGETLRARLEREHRLAVEDAVRIAGDVAEALDHAHRHGVVHRDVKPENILLLDGRALVADFGIALAVEQAGGGRVTRTGISLGSPQYMSPEQAAGERHLDARSDVFSLGTVLYEMLAGAPPHAADTPREAITRLLVQPPAPLSDVRHDVPAALEGAVMRALAKSPDDRFRTAAELRSAVAAASVPDSMRGQRAGWSAWTRPALITGLAALVAVAAIVVVRSRSTGGDAAFVPGKLTHFTRDPGLEFDPALSPDGRALAYAAGPPGDMRIYVRQLAGGRPIAVAESFGRNQRWPQWSPDGTRLVFQIGELEREAEAAPTALYVVPSLGGQPRRLLADSSADLTPAWSPEGTRIAFVRDVGATESTLLVADADGSTPPRRLASIPEAWAPRWSPDGSMIALVSGNDWFSLATGHLGNDAPARVVVVTVADGRVHPITSGTSFDISPVWAPDGRTLLFVSNRDGTRDVYRVRVSRSGELEGAPIRLTSGVNASAIDIARDGRTLSYAAYTPYSHIWRIAIPAAGAARLEGATQVTVSDETVEGMALSADGQRLAYDSDRSGNGDIWEIPVTGGTPVQLTTDPHGDYVQDWSPDGTEIAFHSFRTGRRQVFIMKADGSGAQRVTNMDSEAANPDFSPDGNSLAFDVRGGPTNTPRLFITSRPRRGAPFGTPRQVTTRPGSDASWSPDGRWIAYVYDGVRIVSPSGDSARLVVPRTTGGDGVDPRFAYWSPDGRTIFYKAYDARGRSSIWSVPLAGGTPRLIIRFDDPSRPSTRREIATDGKWLYFTVADHESDIWLMELGAR